MDTFAFIPVLEQFGWRESAIGVQTRSLLSVMLFLAGGIDLPGEDSAVYGDIGPGAEGGSEWGPESILDVRVSSSRPGDAAVAIEMRGHWFSIAGDDANSQTTFALLGYLLRLQEARDGSGSPGILLTIPTG